MAVERAMIGKNDMSFEYSGQRPKARLDFGGI
jgi:hypothetical protein